MHKILIIVIILISLLGGGIFFFSNRESKTQEVITVDQMKENGKVIEGYQGNVLAGTSSPFIEFNKSDYDKAKSEGKIILLDFYANWCPICRAEEPEIFAGFEELKNDNIVGFRVNFNDPDTDDEEHKLASEFKIPYQHTKVILKNGQEISRSQDQWDKEDFINAVNSAM